MHKFFNITALAFAGLIAIASSAQAGGLYDNDDDYNTSQNYDRKSPSSFCYKHPYDDACDGDAKRDYRKRDYGSYTVGRCAPLVRAVGKRNLFLGFARNSALFAWAREARFVHGEQYGNWNNSRDAHISCTRIGGLNSCEATAKPCL